MTSNLSAALTSFVGRDDELAQLRARISGHRLVTLTGEGGSGKTRLAARLCGELESSVDELWWVDLGSVTAPDLVVRAVAEAIGVRAEPEAEALSGLKARFRAASVVLCLDTCEHLLDAVAGLTHRLLLDCERLVVLATSREALGVPGEAVYRVPGLTPADAARLFSERAGLSDPQFTLAGAEADVAAICARLDGLPLAIELAAAWLDALTPAQVVAGLGGNLELLGGGPRTAVPRHRALVASMDWSHDLLSPHEQQVLRRLAVFVGTFTPRAAVSAAREDDQPIDGVLTAIRRLLDTSLVATRRQGDEVRYRLLDTVRHYAFDKLRQSGEAEQIRDRHLRHYLDLAREAEAGSVHDQDHWREVLDAEHDNIHAALQWGLRPARADQGRLLAASMCRHWLIRSQAQEGLGFLRRALDLAPADRSALQARLYVGRSMLSMVAGHLPQVAEAAEAAEEIAIEAEDTRVRAQATAMRAYRLFFLVPTQCEDLVRRAKTLSISVGDVFTRDWATALDAYTLTRRDRHDAAVSIARPAYQQTLARHDRFCGSFLLGVDMLAQLHTGDVRRAVAIGHEVMALAEPMGDYFVYGSNATNVAHAFGMSGDIDRAKAMMTRVAQDIDESSDVDVIAYMCTIGLLHLWTGRPEVALPWFERGMQQQDSFEWTAIRCLVPLAASLRHLGRADEAGQFAARAAAAAVKVDSPHVLATAWEEEARLLTDADPARAFDRHHKVLALRREHGLRTYLPDSLDALAYLAADGDSPEAAVRMLAAGQSAREAIGYPRPAVDQPAQDRAIATLMRRLGAPTYDEQWAEGSGLTLDQIVNDVTRGRGPRGRPSSGWSSLSATELMVADLVADGVSNPEIARRMYISRSTVKTHLSHVYAKLGTSSRTELAAIAAAARQQADPPSAGA